MKRHLVYQRWAGMKQRCYNDESTSFEHYGGRGIRVCDEWKDDFQAFYDWAMANGCKKGLTLDRIDTNKDYSPNNCRWTTHHYQNRNKRNNKLITIGGETKILDDWCRELNLNHTQIAGLIKRNKISPESALTENTGRVGPYKNKETFDMKQGPLIKEYRLKKGLTQKELADKLWPKNKAAGQLISNLERGMCGIPKNKIKLTAKILGIPPKVLADAFLEDMRARLT